MLVSEEAVDLAGSMPTQILADIALKVQKRQRLSPEEGIYLLNTKEAKAVKTLANYVRSSSVGDVVYFSTTLFIHPTNLCENSCPMCRFYAKPGWKSAWFLTPEDIEAMVRARYLEGITEVHIVGGLWKECDLHYYQDVFKRIKGIDTNLHLKALSPVEYHFLAKLHHLSLEEVFHRMISWGLDSIPGGGAEILVEEVRQQIAPQKISSDEYLDAHKIAHRLGLKSNVTMLFDHIESYDDIITHLCRVRELQDVTGGFQAFIPLKFCKEDNALGLCLERLKPKDVHRIFAVSRLMLDNIPHIKVLWNYVGIKEAQEILDYGANDFGSTALEEKVIGADAQVKITASRIYDLIEAKGRIPQHVDSDYDCIYDCMKEQ